MEAPQQRRRRPATTYGKSVKKRYSGFGVGDAFSSATSSREDEQRTKTIRSSTILVTTAATTVRAQKNREGNETIKSPALVNGGEANSLAKPLEKRPQMTLKGNNKRSRPASAMTSPQKHLKVFDFDSSDEGFVQPRKTTSNPKGNDEFDVPSSDEESLAVKKTLLRPSSKALGASANMRRFAKEVKPGVPGPPTRDNKLLQNNLQPKEQGKQTSTKSVTTASRIVKFPSLSKGFKTSKAPKSSNTTPPESGQAVTDSSMSLTNFGIDELVSQRSRVTSSQSRLPEVDQEALEEQRPEQEARSNQVGLRLGSSNELAKPSKLIATKRARRVVYVPLPIICNESPRPSSPPSLQLSPQATRRDSIPYSPGIFSHVDKLSKKDKKQNVEPKRPQKIRGNVPRISEIFQNGVEESAPRRRRLIDRLGTGASQLDLMESLSSGDDESEEEYSQSQSRNIPESQIVDTVTEGQSQESTTEPLVKLVYSNGRVGPKITYARQRSFRMEELDENALFNTPLIMAHQQSNTGLDEGEELEDDTGSKMMKTIHELREAGTNNRFLDDIEELFGDIEGGTPLSRQRSG